MSKLEQRDVRWEAEMHFKISVALELADRVDEAVKHVSIAQSQLKELVKEVMPLQSMTMHLSPFRQAYMLSTAACTLRL